MPLPYRRIMGPTHFGENNQHLDIENMNIIMVVCLQLFLRNKHFIDICTVVVHLFCGELSQNWSHTQNPQRWTWVNPRHGVRHLQPSLCENIWSGSRRSRQQQAVVIKVIHVTFCWFRWSKWKTALLRIICKYDNGEGREVAKEACTDKSAALGICNFSACVLLINWLF